MQKPPPKPKVSPKEEKEPEEVKPACQSVSLLLEAEE